MSEPTDIAEIRTNYGDYAAVLAVSGIARISNMIGAADEPSIIGTPEIQRFQSARSWGSRWMTLKLTLRLPQDSGAHAHEATAILTLKDDGISARPSAQYVLKVVSGEMRFRGTVGHDDGPSWHIAWQRVSPDQCIGHEDEARTCDMGICNGCGDGTSSSMVIYCPKCATAKERCMFCGKKPR